jgi:hypothetical protein
MVPLPSAADLALLWGMNIEELQNAQEDVG